MNTREFRSHEMRYGAPLTLVKSIRVSQALNSHLETEALATGTDASSVVRHALAEFFERKGADVFTPAG